MLRIDADVRIIEGNRAAIEQFKNDYQDWTELEAFFQKSWDVRFTHGYCPDCMSELLAEASARRDTDSKEAS